MADIIFRKFRYCTDFPAVYDFILDTLRHTFPAFQKPRYCRRRLSYEMRFINKSKRTWLQVAVADSRVVGFIWVDFRGPGYLGRKIGFVHYLYVSPEYRQHGLATRLKKIAEKVCRARGCDAVEGVVARQNKAMIKLNKKLGYKITRYVFSKSTRA